LIAATLRTIKLFTASSGIPPSIAVLAEGVLQTMYWTRVKIVMVVVMLAGLGGVGTTFWAASPKPAESRNDPSQRADTARRGDKAEPSTEEDKLTRAKTQSRLNLRKLALAMQNHSATNKGYMPPAALINKDGKAVLSWRVLLLPYLGERELYEQFKLSEPWDGPNNKKLLSRMPAVYAPPSIKPPQPFSTFYQVFVSPKPKDGRKATEKGGPEIQAAFVQGGPQLFPAHIVDGTANTILIVEAGQAVPWTKPEDLPYSADAPLPELGGLFPGIFHAAFANGHVDTLTKKFDPNALRTVITCNGGELMDFAKFQSHSTAVDWQRKNGELRQDLEGARDRLRLLHEEQDALKQQSAPAKSKQEAESRLDELKQENARLQKELEKMRDEIKNMNKEILLHLQFPQNPPKIKAPKNAPKAPKNAP